MDQITDFLSEYRKKGLSSPTGNHWIDFYEFLKSHQTENHDKPLMPLILAASGESNTTKHHRLKDQLEWAKKVGILEEAIEKLIDIEESNWNRGPLDKWHEENY